MQNIWTIIKREIFGYFSTPIAYIFLITFLVLSSICTFYLGTFLQSSQADLTTFFYFHPWLYLFFIPALTMRLWSEERRGGTIELLFTMPITMPQAVIAKFMSAWLFSIFALFLTFPIWITVNILGTPDNGVIVASYMGSILLAGGYLAIGSCMSSLTKNQIVAFISTLIICLAFILSGFPVVLDLFTTWAPDFLIDAVSSLSFLTHFNAINKGVLDIRDIIYFISLITLFLYANTIFLELKKAE